LAEYDDDDDDDDEESSSNQSELIASYIAFIRTSIKRRWKVGAVVFGALLVVTLAVAKLWPRTYHCESSFMAQQNLFAPRSQGGDALGGAAEVILRHESLETVIKQTNLAKSWPVTRPTLLAWKDSLFEWLHGPTSEEDTRKMLVGTLESKLFVSTTSNTVTVSVDWQSPQVAAQIVDAVEQNFLESRHVAEISTIAEYISILESHAIKSRDEIYKMSEQLQKLRDDRIAKAESKAAAQAKDGAPAPVVVRRTPTHKPLIDDEDLTRAKVMLEAKQRAIQDLETDRQQRLLSQRGKLAELQSQYTAVHPLIVDTERTIESLSHESPQVTSLKAEVRDLEGELKKRTAESEVGGATAGGSVLAAAPGSAEPLPADIVRLADDEDLDPAVTAQFRYAVTDYTRLRDEISSRRIDLDTAQAAFTHRYKIVVPPEVPGKPSKPKVPLVIGAGLFASILFGLLSAVFAELRAGKIIEKWQVYQVELPVLAELRFPPASE
jgi:uncharacterized protein involved in exopolysaccharide biosynthesis